MKLRFVAPSALLALSLSAGARPLAAQAACTPGRTALVLSGGGAKGFVHLGVLRMLDSLGIRPDFIVGTSMGAIVGALYASGYDAKAIDSLARSLPLADLVRPRVQAPSRAYTLYRPLISWEIEKGQVRLAQAAVPEQATDAALNSVLLRSNLQAGGDFRRLPIPFYAVATDLATQRPVPLDSGDLAQAVRASMAIPFLFEPVRIGDQTLADGGLAANVPVRVARELGATRLIISDIIRHQATTPDFASPLTVATALIDYLFSQNGDSAAPGDVRITTDVTGVGNLDFTPAAMDTLIHRGTRTARTALVAGDRCLPHGPPIHPGADTAIQITKLTAPGLSRRELQELLGALGLADGITVKPAVLRRGFDVLARDGRFRAVWLNPSRRDDGVGFDLRVRRAPSGTLGVGLAYDNVLGARMWGGAVLRDPVTRTFELTGIVTFGGFRRDLLLAARRPIRGFGRPAFLLSGFAGQEEVPFYTNTGDSFYHPQVAQAIGVAGWEWQFGTTWLLRMGGEVRAWSDSNSAPHQAVGGVFLAQRATEDGEILTRVELNGTSPFQRAAVQWSEPLHAGDWIVTPTLRAGTIRGDEIPLQETFTLGGFDGFPGLRILERRGENEAFVGMSVSHPIFGPIRLRAELAAGDVRSDSTGVARALFEGEGWLVGARIGFTAPSTVLGPIRLEYGATHLGGRYRDQVFLRVGRWF